MIGCQTIAAALAALNAEAGASYTCAEAGADLAVARDAETAQHFLEAATTGRARFEALFGQTPPPSAVILGNRAVSSLAADLESGGQSVVLPWVDHSEQDALLAERIRAQIVAQSPGLPEAQLDALVARALPAASSEPMDPSLEKAAIAHEFGHLWYLDAYWSSGAEGSAHYGGHAPDWLDEAAAVALEFGPMVDSRRASLLGDDGTPPIGLGEFLTMDHPMATLARAAAERSTADLPEGVPAGARVVRLTGDEADALLAQASVPPAAFYSMAQGFLDYLEDRTGSEPLPEITGWLLDGGSFETWLAGPGAALGLPADMAGLEADWAIWLAQRHAGDDGVQRP